jgi:hypothetical protein
METSYPYYVAVRVEAGQLVKVYRDKKYKTYEECYTKLQKWATVYPNSFSNKQYAILEYTSRYECRIITIFTNTTETIIKE